MDNDPNPETFHMLRIQSYLLSHLDDYPRLRQHVHNIIYWGLNDRYRYQARLLEMINKRIDLEMNARPLW